MDVVNHPIIGNSLPALILSTNPSNLSPWQITSCFQGSFKWLFYQNWNIKLLYRVFFKCSNFQYRKENRKVLAGSVFMTGSSEHLWYNDLLSFCLIHLIFSVLEIFSNRPINGKVKEPKGARVGITNSFTGLRQFLLFFSWYTRSGRKEPGNQPS